MLSALCFSLFHLFSVSSVTQLDKIYLFQTIDRLMETSEVDTSILSSLHDNRFDYLQEDDKENFSDSAFLSENLDKDLSKSLPDLSEITDNDTFLRDNEPSQMMTIDSSWYVVQNLFDSIF